MRKQIPYSAFLLWAVSKKPLQRRTQHVESLLFIRRLLHLNSSRPVNTDQSVQATDIKAPTNGIHSSGTLIIIKSQTREYKQPYDARTAPHSLGKRLQFSSSVFDVWECTWTAHYLHLNMRPASNGNRRAELGRGNYVPRIINMNWKRRSFIQNCFRSVRSYGEPPSHEPPEPCRANRKEIIIGLQRQPNQVKFDSNENCRI